MGRGRTLICHLALVSASLLTTGCASSYLGVADNSLPPELRGLYIRASTGDKAAQYDLALAYSEGRSVVRDCKRAEKLMRASASSSGGTIWVYSPPVTKGASGRVIPVDNGPKIQGLARAKAALLSDQFCSPSEGASGSL